MTTVEIVRDGRTEPVCESMPGEPDNPTRCNPGAWVDHLMSMEPRARETEEARNRETARERNAWRAERRTTADDSDLFPETREREEEKK